MSSDNPTGPEIGPMPAPRRLIRTTDDAKLGGVCGGLARYANVDATLVRVLSVVAGVVFFPFSILAYLLLWLVMPTA